MGLINVWASRIYAGQYKHGVSGEEYEHHFETFPHVALSKVRANTNGVSGEEYEHHLQTFPHVELSKVCVYKTKPL